jgi:hypothetical protein
MFRERDSSKVAINIDHSDCNILHASGNQGIDGGWSTFLSDPVFVTEESVSLASLSLQGYLHTSSEGPKGDKNPSSDVSAQERISSC